jgi:23S rRNA G2445 N2-methylase RlmL
MRVWMRHRAGLPKFAVEPAQIRARIAPVLAHFGFETEEFHNQCSIEKVRPRATQVGNSIQHQGTGGIEDRLLVVAIELAASETAAGG